MDVPIDTMLLSETTQTSIWRSSIIRLNAQRLTTT